ncbi:glutamate--tRNA ligase [Marispirochaeta aestuarii]|uniref:glutamate--tRNA ligase n=1 Tax=Marispirochaeta aestuarii TaxID=1963862 RepID=UPI002ABE0BDC|nr:glutamate--tRNA ligase [Marispirochaeta aestuarii]
MSVRVRYAPSPTGLQHIGGVRTALFNYFFARSQGGSFILRVEDTDRTRYSDEALQDLYDTFKWLGIRWDEGPDVGGDFGPYVQSERFDLYREYADRLLESGHAYRCYCTAERLEELRKSQKKATGYDRRCRDLSPEEEKRLAEELKSQGQEPVIRFKIPLEGSTSFSDEIMGTITRKNRDINPDPVILKGDGFPTYHLANVVDDHLMEITHILRAQEWIPSGPLHVLLYEAFGWEPPKYCHLPMVMGKDGQKLSKRHGSTSVREFRNEGYLPEALLNYVSLLGWSYNDSREFFTREELEELFSLEKLNKAPGVFDYKKLAWFNGQYIRQTEDGELKEALIPFLVRDGIVSDPPTEDERRIIDNFIPLVKPRLKTLGEIAALVRFLFQDVEPEDPEIAVPKKLDLAETIGVLEAGRELISRLDSLGDEEMEEQFRARAQELEVKLGDMMGPLRVGLTGSTVSPPLIESCRLIGTDESLRRIDRLIAALKGRL